MASDAYTRRVRPAAFRAAQSGDFTDIGSQVPNAGLTRAARAAVDPPTRPPRPASNACPAKIARFLGKRGRSGPGLALALAGPSLANPEAALERIVR
jgi:hypothetical protein